MAYSGRRRPDQERALRRKRVRVCVCVCMSVYVLAIRWLYDSAFEQHVRLIAIWEVYMR